MFPAATSGDMSMISQTILVAGPYRSGTGDDPALIERNMRAMNQACLSLFRAGHLPLAGEWLALPLIETAGGRKLTDPQFEEIFHPVARRLLERCDAVLRIGGPSKGVDEMMALAEAAGRTVYRRIEDIPT
jgi:hypothetical protein